MNLTATNKKLLLILLLGFLVRFPGIWWGELYNPVHNYFEPDEHQHLSLAIETAQIFNDNLFADFEPNRLNTQGFSTQLGFIGALILPFVDSDYRLLLILGRFLSLFYGLGVIWVTFKIGKLVFEDEKIALLSALLLSIFDLNVTYSHYAVPEVFHVFWAYLAIYFTIKFWNLFLDTGFSQSDRSKYLNLTLISLAFCLSAKYDFIPILVFGMMGIWKLRNYPNALFRIGIVTPLLLILYFELVIWFQNETLIHSFQWLLDENKNLIGNDNHLILNPFLYLIGAICGTSIFAFYFFGVGIVKKLKSFSWKEPFTFSPMAALLIFVLLEFLVLWNLDAPFVRRINIFLPFIALFSSFGLYKSYVDSHKRRWAIGITIIYTFGMTLVSQSNFIKDTRYEARALIEELSLQDEKIFYCPYSKMKGMPASISDINKADYLVIHESYFRRYWKSFTTSFRIPECCEGVYHCKSEEECLKFQEILNGESDLEILRKIQPLELFPERILYKKYFGTYETFLGDVIIYQHTPK